MASLLSQAFQNAKNENRPALLTYTVAGDNTKKKSLEILKSISNYADICELGMHVPWSLLKRRRQDGLRPGHASRGRARVRCRRQYGKPRQQFTNKEI